MNATFVKIIKNTGRKPKSCKCKLCKQQCVECPCLGTPDDILKLINAGYKDKLAVSDWWMGMLMGKLKSPVTMVQALHTETGCIFFENGLCALHDLGLKPTEGRLSHHTMNPDKFKFGRSISWNVVKEWLEPENREKVDEIFSIFNEDASPVENAERKIAITLNPR